MSAKCELSLSPEDMSESVGMTHAPSEGSRGADDEVELL